jgi:phenylglyoxylate dehydrogenase epsilon subunit
MPNKTQYVIAGASHAGLTAAEAIRMQDPQGLITIVSREETLPYSPTILPYVVSGAAEPQAVFVRTAEAFRQANVRYLNNQKVVQINSEDRTVLLHSGRVVAYDKLLLATGAAPLMPPIEGLQATPFHVLRTLVDALAIKKAMAGAQSAIILGAGLIGLHLAENLVQAGLRVCLADTLDRILPRYLDPQAAALLEKVYRTREIDLLLGQTVQAATRSAKGCRMTLQSGKELAADLLLIAVGVRPNMDYLNGSGIKIREGILVDEYLRTSAAGIWAAGDVCEAKGFFETATGLNATLPNAVDQGRLAGLDMSGAPDRKPFEGNIALNTMQCLGQRVFTAGLTADGLPAQVRVEKILEPEKTHYRKLVFRGERLVGACGINTDMDPGIMLQLIRRRVDLGADLEAFIKNPMETGRLLMSREWR